MYKALEDREILESFARYVKNGLVPNVFPDIPEPVYTVDATMYIHGLSVFTVYRQ